MNVKTIFNSTILPQRGLRAVKTESFKTFGPDLTVGIAANTGTIRTRLDPGLVVEVLPGQDTFDWAELKWITPAHILRNYGRFIFCFDARAQQKTTLRCAMRLHYPGRFEDVFAPRKLKLTPKQSVQEITFDLSPRQLAGCGDIHLQVFFGPEENQISFDRIELTALH